jgi:ethanolamine utilization microcompartment shell protein EutL
MDFLFDRVIRVRVGSELSMGFEVNNGTPQGCVVSPVLFTLMIDYIFKGQGVGLALYADDGKRGWNVKYLMRKM